MSFRTPLLAVSAVAALAAAGCGSSNNNKDKVSAGSSDTSSAPAKANPAGAAKGQTITLSADPSKIAFDTKKLSAKAGTVTVSMKNPSQIPHAIAVEGNGVDKDGKTVSGGGTSTVTVKLKPGKYQFYCPVPGHKQQGMAGTLTVG